MAEWSDGNTNNSLYAWTDAALGSSSLTGTITSLYAPHNELIASIAGSTLTLSGNETVSDQAYFVEYLSADTTSSNLLGGAGTVITSGVATGTVAMPAGTDFARVTITEGRTSNNFRHEDKGASVVHIDTTTNTASGVIFFESGRGDDFTASYAFTGYDLTSGVSILSSSATVVGDTSATAANLSDPILSLSGGNLTITRTAAFADDTTSMVNISGFERLNAGSVAFGLGSSSAALELNTGNGTVDEFDFVIPRGAETANISYGQVLEIIDLECSIRNPYHRFTEQCGHRNYGIRL